MSDWQPIESAPRDRWIELHRPPASYGSWQRVVTAIWNDEDDAFVWPSDPSDDPLNDISLANNAIGEGDICQSATDWTHWREVTLPEGFDFDPRT